MEPTQSPVEASTPQPESHWLIVTLSVVGIVLFTGILFLYLQNQKLQKKVTVQSKMAMNSYYNDTLYPLQDN